LKINQNLLLKQKTLEANEASRVKNQKKVELVGFEPTSKHIRRKLSTCLFWNWLSEKCRNQTNQHLS